MSTLAPAAPPVPAAACSAPRLAPFNLTRQFSLVSLACIALVCGLTATVLARFLVERMLQRDAEVAMQFVQSLVARPGAAEYFAVPNDSPAGAAHNADMESFFERIRAMPDVRRAHVYRADRSIVWSSDRAAVGRTFENNPELDTALQGRLAIEAEILEHRRYVKPEHVFSGDRTDDVVENYIPVWDESRSRVLGVVELYKESRALFDTIGEGLRLIWLCAFGAALVLFGALFWTVRRADNLIRAQQAQLLATATTAAVGDLAAAIAHGIRNPLAAIRSSAELLDDPAKGPTSEEAIDIMAQVDRIEASIRTLLAYTQRNRSAPEPVDLNEVARSELAELGQDLVRRSIALDARLDADLPEVLTTTALDVGLLADLRSDPQRDGDGRARVLPVRGLGAARGAAGHRLLLPGVRRPRSAAAARKSRRSARTKPDLTRACIQHASSGGSFAGLRTTRSRADCLRCPSP